MCSCDQILVELPHDTFAEQYVLASCLKKPDLVGSCRLQPRDFYHLAHRQAWAAILEVGADLDELGEALHYGAAYLALWQADWSLPSQGRSRRPRGSATPRATGTWPAWPSAWPSGRGMRADH